VVGERDGTLLGFRRLAGEPPEGVLESLFVDLPAIGTGVGRLLFDDAGRARRLGLSTLADRRRSGRRAVLPAHGGHPDR
jgi:hypothetical protein